MGFGLRYYCKQVAFRNGAVPSNRLHPLIGRQTRQKPHPPCPNRGGVFFRDLAFSLRPSALPPAARMARHRTFPSLSWLPLLYKYGNDLRITVFTRCLIGYGTGWHRMNEAALGRFGDKRREDLGAVLLDAVESKRTLCIHRLAEDRNQTIRFNNFLANPGGRPTKMPATAGRKTNQCAAGRHVLAIMDTTDVLFPSQKANKRGFGLGSDGEHPGLFLHPVGVDAANGGIIGLVNCIVLNRTEGRVSEAKTGAKKKVKTHKKRSADDKEFRRWLQGSEMAGDCLTDADMITMVGDREGDIYHLLANRPANVHLLVRSAQPRALTAGGLLPDYCAALPEQARETIDVPAKGKQPARKATVAMRYGPVSLSVQRIPRTTANRKRSRSGSLMSRKSIRPRGWNACTSGC